MRTLASAQTDSIGLVGRVAVRVYRASGHALQTILRLPVELIERSRQRGRLARLDDNILKDIGLMRGQVEQEIDKWFWQR